MRTDLLLRIHLSIGGHLGCSQFLAIANNAAVDICIQVLVGTYVFSCLGTDLEVERLGRVTRQVTLYTLW